MAGTAKHTSRRSKLSQSHAQAQSSRREGVVNAPSASTPQPKEEAVEYDPQRGWLTPWKATGTPVTPAATPRERAVVAKYIDFRNKMRNGPLYTVLGTNVRVKKRYSAATTIGINPFHRTTYSHRYRRTDRTAPDLSNLAWSALELRFCP
jgi:hypothetical protein